MKHELVTLEELEMDPDLILGQSRAYHWTANFLDSQLEGPLVNDQLAAAGCGLSSILLRAFAIELVIKALYVKQSGLRPAKVHRLDFLFCQLKPATRKSVNKRFQTIWRGKPGCSDKSESLQEVLATYKSNFEDWRYLHELGGNLNTDFIALNSAIEAFTEEYLSS